jgi:hypothetical protein
LDCADTEQKRAGVLLMQKKPDVMRRIINQIAAWGLKDDAAACWLFAP